MTCAPATEEEYTAIVEYGGTSSHSLGYLASLQGDRQQADVCYREGLSLAREIGDDKLMAWHLTTIYSKLQVSSRAAATRYAIEQRLV